ncbi:MAG: hypothetical protein U5K84_00025 [Alkalibacterium sp.]|nr:hypothetical protein [Alkalibacterium sp.]
MKWCEWVLFIRFLFKVIWKSVEEEAADGQTGVGLRFRVEKPDIASMDTGKSKESMEQRQPLKYWIRSPRKLK